MKPEEYAKILMSDEPPNVKAIEKLFQIFCEKTNFPEDIREEARTVFFWAIVIFVELQQSVASQSIIAGAELMRHVSKELEIYFKELKESQK